MLPIYLWSPNSLIWTPYQANVYLAELIHGYNVYEIQNKGFHCF